MPTRKAALRPARADDGGIRAPPGLQALTFRVGIDRFVVFSYPLVPTDPPADLTRVERDVVAAVLQGKTNADIARERGRSVRTIANQVSTVFKKLGVTSRAQLAAQCVRGPERQRSSERA